MKLYNTMTRQKEPFVPLRAGEARIYACGPTVYNYIHVGNARQIVVFDTLRRYLELRGFHVLFVQNFTDVDDKMIRRAAEENTTVAALAEKYIAAYNEDAKGLNVRSATFHPRATQTIPDIIALVQALVEKGFAYVSDGDVYFRAHRFAEYGKLSHQPLEDLEAGARVDVSERKEDPVDFALWKAAKPGEPSWSSPWGDGRPGWHIECSAMARHFLGETIDIHGGGQDLIFPHHENEIAQSECANGKPFARYWMHNGYVNIDNRKMSKSAGNFFTVREVATRYGYEAIRFLMLSAQYRTPINYSDTAMAQAVASLDRLYNCRAALKDAFAQAKDGDAAAFGAAGWQVRFNDAMDDDLITADAVAVLFELTKEINTAVAAGTAGKIWLTAAQGVFDSFCDVLGLLYERKEEQPDDDIAALIEKREQARKAKDFKTADNIRDTLRARGVELRDTPQGVKWEIRQPAETTE